jgi:Zn-dependent protease
MNWSIKLGRFAGIDVNLHLTFFLLLAFFGFSAYMASGSLAGVWDGLLYILALFGCVVLHEYGHALAARRYGIPTRDITLYPIGGVARLERMPEKPTQELVVALAGPLVNVVIAVGLFVFLWLTNDLTPITRLSLLQGGSLLERLMYVNVSLVLFNLLPAFPMDGGRVLRAILAMNMAYGQATRIAAMLGQGMALLFGFIGLFTNPMLILVAVFVWIAAGQEAQMVQVKSVLGGIPVSRAMQTDFRTVSQYDPLLRVTDMLMSGSQEDFPVVEDGRVVGVITRSDLLTALSRFGIGARVAEVMRRNIPMVDPLEMLEPVFARMRAQELHTVPVVSGGQIVGLLTSTNVGEYLMIQRSLHARRRVVNG